jgi:hypothetical protein
VKGCRHHAWTEWYQTGMFDSTWRRDCKRCRRIQTRLQPPPGVTPRPARPLGSSSDGGPRVVRAKVAPKKRR